MEREKGQDVASMSCPNCGADTPLVAMPDGGLAQGVCSNCFGQPEVASSAAPAEESAPVNLKREKTTNVATQEEQS